MRCPSMRTISLFAVFSSTAAQRPSGYQFRDHSWCSVGDPNVNLAQLRRNGVQQGEGLQWCAEQCNARDACIGFGACCGNHCVLFHSCRPGRLNNHHLYLKQPGASPTQAPSTVAPTPSPTEYCDPGRTFWNGARCQPVRSCGPGLGQMAPPTRSTDRVCGRCPPNQFNDGADNFCAPRTLRCQSTEFISVPPTLTSDLQCSTISECDADQYEAQPPVPGRSNRQCADCTVCPEDTHHQVTACTTTENTQCENCQTCDDGTWMSFPCTATSNTNCTLCTSCQQNQYEYQPCSMVSDTDCREVSVPDLRTEFISAAESPTTDAVLSLLSVCAPDEYEAIPPTATSDRRCTAVSVPQVGTNFINTMSTSTSDAVLAPVSRQCSQSQFQSASPSISSDRVCEPLSVCPTGQTPGQYRYQQPTATTDIVCTNCPFGTYKPESGNTACLTADTCVNPGQTEDIPPTSSTNRICKSCDAGTFNPGGSGSNSQWVRGETCSFCTECDSGETEASPCTTTSDRECDPPINSDGSTGSDAEGNSTIIAVVVAAVVIVLLIIVAVALVVRKNNVHDDGEVKAFENPMYDSTPSTVPDGDDRYSQPEPSAASGYMDIPAAAPSSGYMDVAPSAGDDEEEDV